MAKLSHRFISNRTTRCPLVVPPIIITLDGASMPTNKEVVKYIRLRQSQFDFSSRMLILCSSHVCAGLINSLLNGVLVTKQNNLVPN
jgi:hypothetical protein